MQIRTALALALLAAVAHAAEIKPGDVTYSDGSTPDQRPARIMKLPPPPPPPPPKPAPRGVEILSVIRGDLIMARVNGRVTGLTLGGVWVPVPPGLGLPANYMGTEARDMVASRLRSEVLEVQPLAPMRRGAPLPVRILVGPDRFDLAVALARSGYATASPTSAASPEQAAAIREAETFARRSGRGMHDGGATRFAQTTGQEVDFGLTAWLSLGIGAQAEGTFDEGEERVPEERVETMVINPRPDFELEDPREALWTWGRQMGLGFDEAAVQQLLYPEPGSVHNH
jgi:endonuclease YncB( thermonuclease family)